MLSLHSYLANNNPHVHIDFGKTTAFPVSVGKITSSITLPPIENYFSDHLITIYYFYKSSQHFNINNKEFEILSNDLVVINPYTLYSTSNYPVEPLKLYYIQFNPTKFIDVNFAFDKPEGDYIIQELSHLSNNPLKVKANLKLCIENLITTASHTTPLTNTMFRNRLLTIITEIIKYNAAPETLSSSMHYDCIGYIKDHICDPINIAKLADLSNLSPSQFKSKFRKEFHLPPNEYILREKVNYAKTLLLETSLSITTIAHQLSFSSSQYFCTVFKRFTTQSPSDFRKTYQLP